MNLKSCFNFFRKNKKFTYLDSAATTQVPDQVLNVLTEVLSERMSVGRGNNKLSSEYSKKYDFAVDNIASFIGAKSNEVVFSSNSTDSVNLFINSIFEFFESGDEVVITLAEHNSMVLPLERLIKKGVKLRVIDVGTDGLMEEDLLKVLNSKTKLVGLFHVSNVLGVKNDLVKLGQIIKNYNPEILFLVDAAQSVAHQPINVKDFKCDALFFSAHKMYGPDGVGVLYLDSALHALLKPVGIGGGAIKSLSFIPESSEMNFDLISPLSALKSGTKNLSGVLGLSTAVDFIKEIGFEKIIQHEFELMNLLIDGLLKIEGIKIYGPTNLNHRSGLVSFSIEGINMNELTDYFVNKNFCIRYGSHCAFLLNNFLKEDSLRVSFGVYNTESDVKLFLDVLNRFIQKNVKKIENPLFDFHKDMEFDSYDYPVNKIGDVFKVLLPKITSPKDTEVVFMAGHFLAIPDFETNSFYPSIKGLIPERLDDSLTEFGMDKFPLETLEIGSKMIKELKKMNISSKLLVIANDTTGINELKNSAANVSDKTAKDYVSEMLNRFEDGNFLPELYLNILSKYNLSPLDVIKFKNDRHYIPESILRSRFKDMIQANDHHFNGLLEYSMDKHGNLDLSIPILRTPDVKTCVFDSYQSKTGGKFCIVEVCELIAELFGKASKIDYKRTHSNIKAPLLNKKHKIFIMLSPAMCNNAVNSAGELYYKLFDQGSADFDFTYINIPFGKNPKEFLKSGTIMHVVTNKKNDK